jgi:hypothetical protein
VTSDHITIRSSVLYSFSAYRFYKHDKNQNYITINILACVQKTSIRTVVSHELSFHETANELIVGHSQAIAGVSSKCDRQFYVYRTTIYAVRFDQNSPLLCRNQLPAKFFCLLYGLSRKPRLCSWSIHDGIFWSLIEQLT